MRSHHSSGAREHRLIFRFFLLKEGRRYPFFFLLLIFTLGLGTSGLMGISIVSQQVRAKLAQNARELLTSDLSFSARREFTAEEKDKIQEIMSSKIDTSYQIVDIYSMVYHPASGASRLVEIRGTEGNFPFYGELRTRDGVFSHEELSISKDLALLWDIKVGDELVIGSLRERIGAIVEEDSSQGFRGFSLAPRVYLSLDKLAQSGLITLGTSGNFAYHFRLDNLPERQKTELQKQFYAAFPDRAVRMNFPEDTSEQSGRVVSIISSFMSLSGLIGMVLALVGVFYLYQSHLQARLRDLCLLNLFGLTKPQLVMGVLFQFSILFFFVVLLQLSLVLPLYRLFAPELSSGLGLDLPQIPDLSSLYTLIPMLFALSLSMLIPLLMGLMRTSLGAQLKAQKISLGRFRYYDFFPFLGLLWFFSNGLGQNWRTGTLFFVCLLLVFVFSTLVIKLLQGGLRLAIRNRGLLMPQLEAGMAIRGIIRSGHKLTMSFLSLCLGATLISLILQLDHKIQSELKLSGDKPGLFIFDIQEEQLEDLQTFSQDFGVPIEAVTPMVRARLEEVNGKPYERKRNPFAMRSRDNEDDPRTTHNAVNLTYRSYMTPAEKIVEGRPFPEGEADSELALVSVEKRWAQRMGVSLGDRLLFDVQGVEFEGIVHNVKEIRWTSFYPNFFITLQPGFIEGAPKNFLAVFPSGKPEEKVQFQREVVSRFPNISFIDVEELVGKLLVIFEKSRQAIEVISWLSLLVGIVILYGLSHDQVYRRHYDMALLKSLGLSSGGLRLNLLYEFGSVFLVSMGLGLILGWAMANLIGQEVFKLDWDFEGGRMVFPFLLLSVLCLSTILVSSWRAVRSRPRELLSDS